MHLSAGRMLAGRQKKVAVVIVTVGLALAALGSVAVSGPAANAGPVRMSPAEVLGAVLLAVGCTGVLVGLGVWVHAAVTSRWAVKEDDRHPVNHWRGPVTPGRSL
jgi:hypothetical protein